jgi:uncharacterized protein
LKIVGSYTLPVERERAYALLRDPEVLARCLPGVDRLARIGPDEYEMKMKMAVSVVQAVFDGKIRIADPKPPEQFRLLVEGSGKVGFVKGDGLFTLVAGNSSTELRYEGDVQVGGAIAGVGQRLLDTTARFIVKKFFEKFAAEATQASAPSA